MCLFCCFIEEKLFLWLAWLDLACHKSHTILFDILFFCCLFLINKKLFFKKSSIHFHKFIFNFYLFYVACWLYFYLAFNLFAKNVNSFELLFLMIFYDDDDDCYYDYVYDAAVIAHVEHVNSKVFLCSFQFYFSIRFGCFHNLFVLNAWASIQHIFV